MGTVVVAACELTPRCRPTRACRHHVRNCEHKAQWKNEAEKRSAEMDRVQGDIAALGTCIEAFKGMSLQARQLSVDFLYDRFVLHPNCDDDPVEMLTT